MIQYFLSSDCLQVDTPHWIPLLWHLKLADCLQSGVLVHMHCLLLVQQMHGLILTDDFHENSLALN